MLAVNQTRFFFFWIYLLVIVRHVQGCTLQSFKQSSMFDVNFDLTRLQQSYALGDSVRVHCKVGHRGFFKLICSDQGWKNTGSKCRPISCGHPGDVLNADFKLISGHDYEFGSQVQYTCQRGYQMASFTSTRNCLEGGWDGHLPECEPVQCPSVIVSSRVQVYGEVEQPTSGSVVQFSCSSPSDELEGEPQIICGDDGKWDHEAPTCRELSCEIPPLVNFQVVGTKTVYRKNEALTYICDKGFKKVDGRPSTCIKVGQGGQWSPTPRCEMITCKLPSPPPRGTTYYPPNQYVFKTGAVVRVSCGDTQWVKSRELQQADLTCQDTERWDLEPVCKTVTCTLSAQKVRRWETVWIGYRHASTVDIGRRVWYECFDEFEGTSERATCTRQDWEPKPLCKEKGCETPTEKNAEITDYYQKSRYGHNDRVNFKCTYDPSHVFSVYCYLGSWRYSEKCKDKPCTSQPPITNGESLDQSEVSYDDGTSLRFRCKGETDIFRVTCKDGEWSSEKSCEDVPCREQPKVENGEIVGQQQAYRHGEKVLIRCITDPLEIFNASCQSGKWAYKQKCPKRGVCGSTAISNGFSRENKTKLYYACDDGYKLLSKGWWGVASCEQGKWKTSECVDQTDCGRIPNIPNLKMRSNTERFRNGDTFTIICETGYKIHPHVTELICNNGQWTSNNVPINQICRSVEKLCGPPPRVKDAVIMAPFKKLYLSGTSLTYKCRKSLTLEGDDTIQCLDGTWTLAPLVCKAPPIDG